MKAIFLVILSALVSGCASSGYNPSYIISDTTSSHVEAKPVQAE